MTRHPLTGLPAPNRYRARRARLGIKMHWMRAAAVGLVVFLSASASSSAETQSPLRAAIVAYATEVGVAAYHFGACERYVPARDADEIAAALTGADNNQDDAYGIAAAWAKLYGLGRKEAASLDLSVDQCTNLIRKASANMDAAKSKVEAEMQRGR